VLSGSIGPELVTTARQTPLPRLGSRYQARSGRCQCPSLSSSAGM
jgi:hypothetical protein